MDSLFPISNSKNQSFENLEKDSLNNSLEKTQNIVNEQIANAARVEDNLPAQPHKIFANFDPKEFKKHIKKIPF